MRRRGRREEGGWLVAWVDGERKRIKNLTERWQTRERRVMDDKRVEENGGREPDGDGNPRGGEE